jgi:hypothetical protein
MVNVSDNVAKPNAAHQRMTTKCALPRALMGGTTEMRKQGEKYLPKEVGESLEAYQARLKRTVLFNAFEKTIRDMTGKVFRKPMVLGKDVPPKLQAYAENVDLAGRHLNVFARDVFFDGLQGGIAYILVDMPPKVQRQDGAPATVADEQNAGIRPYLCHVKVENLIGWKSTTVNGAEELTQVRIKECVLEPDGEFGEKEVDQIRVLEPGTWRVYRLATQGENGGKWVLHNEGTTSLQKITLAPVYINRTGFMCGEPPLEDLADLNAAHWQSSSDQRNILHVARVPILFGAGFQEGDGLTIGANQMVRSNDPTAKLTYVEHTGKAIESGQTDLDKIEGQMQNQGLQLLVPQPGGRTATGEIRDDSKENSPLAMMATALQDAIEQAFGFMAEYDGLGKDAGGSVTINTDFGVMLNVPELTTLADNVNSGVISRETYWAEIKRRGVLSDAFDAAAEKDRLASEPPRLGGAGQPPMDLGPGPGPGA